MNFRLQYMFFLILLLAITVLALPLRALDQTPATDPSPVVVRFHETDALFRNPGRGWMAFERLPPKTPRLPYAVGYFRLDWYQVEPGEGKFDWSLIDEAIAAWKPLGARIAFRIMTANAHSPGVYCAPKWLFDTGCRGFAYTDGAKDASGRDIARIEPDYADPVYLRHYLALVAQLGKRYDGDPNIEFLDIGGYGIWSEWHTKHEVSTDIRRTIADACLTAFKKTPLVMMSDDADTLAYALPRGAGVRRDGVGSPWHEQNWIGSPKYAAVAGFADAWKTAPVVFEWHGNYDQIVSRGWSFDRAVQFMLRNHVTYINDNLQAVPAARMPDLEKLARLAGYRFVLRELRHDPVVRRGAALTVAMQWANVGVGRLYRSYPLSLARLDERGTPVCQVQAKADPRGWLPGAITISESLPIPATVAPGVYSLALALIDPQTGKPAIQLAIDAPEAQRLYRVSRVTVR
jgi:hypothetical protein